MLIQKKHIYVVFIIGLLFMPYSVFAKTTSDHFEATFIKNYSYVDTKGKHGNFEHFTRESDGTTAFCIEPGVSLSSHTYQGYYDLSLEEMGEKVELSKRRLEKISLYAYFGYGYKGRHKGDDWIVATQVLIWEEAGRNLEFTNGYHPENPNKYIIDVPEEIKDHMDEIKEYVESYLEQPEFFTSHAIIPLKGSYNYGKLNNFEVKECENCSYLIQNKELIVTPLSTQSGRVVLEKNAEIYDEKFIVYASSDGQNVMVTGNLEPKIMEIDFEVLSGKLKLIKYDVDNKSCKPKENGFLQGSVYKLFKEDGSYVRDLIIGENCSVLVENLELGNYYLKEEKAGLNYELDPNTYFFSITAEALTKELVVYDKMFLGQVEIKKYDKDTKSCESISSFASLKGAIYGIYNKDGKLLEELSIDKNCGATSKRNLLLGDYYIQEIQAPSGYKLDGKKYKFSITKENAESILSIVLYDEVYKTEIRLNKTYFYFNSLLPEKEAIFEIYNKKTLEKIKTISINENGFSKIELNYGEYIIKQIKGKEGYYFVEDFVFIVDEHSEDKTEINLVNHPFKGTLEFNKIDSNTGKFLPNVLIVILNEKEEVIFDGKTDNQGKIILKDLAYGKYSIIEKEALKGYQITSERLSFEIKKDKEIVNIVMKNDPIIPVPNTGKSRVYVNIIFACLFLLIGLGMIFYGKEKI